MGKDDVVLYHDRDKVHVGGIFRYTVQLNTAAIGDTLFVRVRNTEIAALRAAYLTGPFTLYVDVTPYQYSEHVKTPEGAEPRYENHLKAGSHFSAELKVLQNQQMWVIDVFSEILFSRSASVGFELVIGTTKAASKLHGSSTIQKHMTAPPAFAQNFTVRKQDTASLWQLPIPRPNEPLHVCVLTHGLVSNVTADMFYIKELLDQAAQKTGENLVVKGYTGNVCRTERGVKYLGRRVADWIMNELIPTYQPAKLSFVSHSLGGTIQTYALGYLEATHPEVLRDIELVNFVAMASPFLGISNENPGYVRFALDFGFVGKTGRDLGLSWVPGSRPLLEELPNDHTRRILRRFRHRTLYANSVNDGIVPLRTASMLYLDWRALGLASESQHQKNVFEKSNVNSTHPHLLRHHHSQNHFHNHTSHQDSEKHHHHGLFHRHDRDSESEESEENPHHHYQLLPRHDHSHDHNHDHNHDNDHDQNQNQNHNHDHHHGNDHDTDAVRRQMQGDRHIHPISQGSDSNLGSPKSPDSPGSINSTSSAGSPFASFLFGDTRKAKMLSRFQTVSTEESVPLEEVGERLPHKTSLIESGMSLLLPPHPDRAFITDPDCRDNVVFHDRVYFPEDLPKRRFKEKLSVAKGRKEKVEVARSEERIARQYHEGMPWRKVLVQLLPEAHNNIIVRRRFSNAYGWPVVHHVVREHFVNPGPSHDAHDPSLPSVRSEEQILWNQSDEDKEGAAEPGLDEHDPQRVSMLKIIPTKS